MENGPFWSIFQGKKVQQQSLMDMQGSSIMAPLNIKDPTMITQNIQANKNSRLIKAAKESDHLGVTRALQDGADVNTCIPWGRCKSFPLLSVAVGQGKEAMVTALLAGKPDVEARGDYWAAPLAMATVMMSHTTIVTQLLDYGAYSNSKDSWGATAVHLAAAGGDISTIQLLHQRGGRLEDVDNAGCTPLHRAAYGGHRPMVEWLIRQGVDAGVLNMKGATAADRAESQRHKHNIAESQRQKHLIADLRSYAAKQKIQMKHIQELIEQLEQITSCLLGWIEVKITELKDHYFPNTIEGIQEMLQMHQEYKGEEKLSKKREGSEIKQLLFSINEKLFDIYKTEYIPKNGHQLHDIEQMLEQLEVAENARKDALMKELERQENLQQLAEKCHNLSVQCSAYIEKKFQMLRDQRYNGDTGQYEEVVKKHDIYIKQIEIEAMTTLAKNLVSENYHNADRICILMEDTRGKWKKLLEKNEKYLDNCHQLQFLLEEEKTISSHCKELKEFFQRNDCGQTLVEVEDMLKLNEQKKAKVFYQFDNFNCQSKEFEVMINREDRTTQVLKNNRQELKSNIQNILSMADDHQLHLEKKIFQIQMKHIQELIEQLEQITSCILGWIEAKITDLKDHRFPNSIEGIQDMIKMHQEYKGEEKLTKNGERSKIERLLLSINTKLIAINETEYIPKHDHQLNSIEQMWEQLEVGENSRKDALLKELKRQENFQQLADKFESQNDLCREYIEKNIHLLRDQKYNSDLAQVEEIVKKSEILDKENEMEEMKIIANNLVSENYHDADRVDKSMEDIQSKWRELLEKNEKYLDNCQRLQSLLEEAKMISSHFKALQEFFQRKDCGQTLAEVEDLLRENEQKKAKASAQFKEFKAKISRETLSKQVLENQKQELRSNLKTILTMAEDHRLRLEKKRDLFKFEHIQELKEQLEPITSCLMGWMEAKITDLKDHRFPNTIEGIHELIKRHQEYKGEEKLSKNRERPNIERLQWSIIKKLIYINETENIPKNGHQLQDIEQMWEQLEVAENSREDALLKELKRQENLQQLAEKFENLNDLCRGYIEKNINLLHDPKYNSDLAPVEEIVKKSEILVKQREIDEMTRIAKNLVSENYHDADRIRKFMEDIQSKWKELLEKNKKYLDNCHRLQSLLEEEKTISSHFKELEEFCRIKDFGQTLTEVEDLLRENEQKKAKASAKFKEFEAMISGETIAMQVLENKRQELRLKLQNILKLAEDHRLRLEKKRDSFKFEGQRKNEEDADGNENESYAEELKNDIKNLNIHKAKGTIDLIKYIYKTWPPKNKNHDIPVLAPNIKVQKLALRTALKHYHPDKQNLEVHGEKWIKLTDEIAKALNEKYKAFK